MKQLAPADRERIELVIAAHLHEWTPVRGFLAAQAGFPVSGGQLIREPAILVFVRQKLKAAALAPRDLLPREIDGIRVDVIQTDPRTELELLDRSDTPPNVGAAAVVATPYEGLPGDPIDETFTVQSPMLCHVGPDAGWAVLRDFLAGTREGLTAAMYDFNADYIERTLIDVSEAEGIGIVLTLDNGLGADERALQDRLRERLAAAYDAAIVICRSTGRFPSAYHQKVAVRDGASFWLSSGNWSRTSQPEIDPIGQPADAQGMYSKGNREWHIVVDDESVAKLFARYIKHDLDTARADATPAGVGVARPDVFVRLSDLTAEFAMVAAAPPVPVAPERIPTAPRPITVRPLLSPDNYARRVEELIRSAQHRLYLQYSYINWTNSAVNAGFTKVLKYLGKLSWRTDFDLRVIVSSTDAASKVRVLAENGWKETVVRSQSRLHNKGIVADGERVLVSSQNWSGDGFLRNRDAGLIVHDTDVARYYETVFLDDWNRRTKSPLTPGPVAMIAHEGDPIPPGMVRMSWRDFYGE